MATEVLPDGPALRTGRRERALARMAAHDIDILVLGRAANVRYVTGAHRLWVAGTHPFGPSCVLVRSTGTIHLLSTWDEGVPEDIPHERLFGITWNPMNAVSVLQAIPGAAGARRVGTDALSPLYAGLLPVAFPRAELVDGEPAMREARRNKTPDEMYAVREAIAIAESSLAAAVDALRPGISEREVAGVLLEAAARSGVATPAIQDVAWLTTRPAGEDRRARPGDLMAITAGVVADGYIGEVTRTWPIGDAERTRPIGDSRNTGPAGAIGRTPPVGAVGHTLPVGAAGPASPVGGGGRRAHRALVERWDRLWDGLAAACRPGATAAGLLDAYRAAGEALPPMPVAHGLGLGFDPPVVTGALPATAAAERFEPGMVLAVTGYVSEPGAGAVLGREAVLITADGREVLTSAPFWREG
jgi:Xaa-Pro aminopeptidase